MLEIYFSFFFLTLPKIFNIDLSFIYLPQNTLAAI